MAQCALVAPHFSRVLMVRFTLIGAIAFAAACSSATTHEEIRKVGASGPKVDNSVLAPALPPAPVVAPFGEPSVSVGDGVAGAVSTELVCPIGESLVGIQTYGGRRVSGIALACGVAAGSDSRQSDVAGSTSEVAELTICDAGERVIGVVGNYDESLTTLRAVCGSLGMDNYARAEAALAVGVAFDGGFDPGQPFRALCSVGEEAVGATVRAGALVSAFSLHCSAQSRGFLAPPADPVLQPEVLVPPGQGWARVDAVPAGAVSLNGEIVAYNTPAIVPVSPGRHELVVVWPDSVSSPKTVQIEARNETIVYFSARDEAESR